MATYMPVLVVITATVSGLLATATGASLAFSRTLISVFNSTTPPIWLDGGWLRFCEQLQRCQHIVVERQLHLVSDDDAAV